MLTKSTASFTDGMAIVAGRDKNQVASLELKETMILCRRVTQTTHIKSIAVFFHPMEQIEVASGKFNMVTTEAEFTRLESELSFLQVKSTMTQQETIGQVKAEICEDRKQIAHTRLALCTYCLLYIILENINFFHHLLALNHFAFEEKNIGGNVYDIICVHLFKKVIC